ncbi:MAG: ArsR/SmtB family transcription factor [Chloroflexota bacterium]
MSDSEETIYSTMFSSLKHPVRRKVLRVLSDKPTSFSQMLEELGVSSSHLTYHLESLGELVTKTDSGDYKLSTFGEAAVNTMRIVEDAPTVTTTMQRWSLTLGWKAFLGALIIGIVLLASFSAIQYNAFSNLSTEHNDLKVRYQQLLSISSGTDKAIKFFRDVIQLDLTKYEPTISSNTIDNPSELGGLPQQILHCSLSGSNSRLEAIFVFKNNFLSKYQLSVVEGSPIYSEAQPFTVLDSAKWLIHQLRSYEDAPYLDEMNSTLYQLRDETKSIQLFVGNLKFNMSVLGANTEMQWYYSENNVDFVQKGVKLVYENQVLKELDDGYYLYSIDNVKVNIDQASAVQAARNAVKDYQLSSGGQQVYYKVLDQPVSVVFDPRCREAKPLALVPHWTITLYLDTTNQQININRLAVSIWADTGEIDGVQALAG